MEDVDGLYVLPFSAFLFRLFFVFVCFLRGGLGKIWYDLVLWSDIMTWFYMMLWTSVVWADVVASEHGLWFVTAVLLMEK